MSPQNTTHPKTPPREPSGARRIWRVFEYRRPIPVVRPRFTT
jgi:hypothetical protein